MTRTAFLALALVAVPAALLSLNPARTQNPAPAPPADGTVTAFGARGDGTADDSAAVQKAVDSGAGLVRFPKGVFRFTKTVVVDLAKTGFVSLEGGGVARVVMAGEGPAFKFVGTHGGTAAPDSVKDGVWAKERTPAVNAIEIVGGHEKAVGIEAAGTMQLTLTRVSVRDCLHGIHLTQRNRNVLISDCHLYHNRGIGLFLDDVNLHQINVTGSHVSYNRGGGVVVRAGQVRNLHVTGCDVEANHAKDGPPTANILIDSTGGTNAEVAITGCTVQHTRNAPGSANIRVKGPTTPLKGTDEVRDGHVTITGNVLSDVKVNVHLDHARGVTITGNTFWTGVEHNLLCENSTCVVVGPNNMDRNPRYFREEGDAGDGVTFRNSTDCTVTGLQVKGVKTAPAGVVVEKCDRFNVTGLTVLDCDGAGLQLTDVTNSRFGGCLIRDDRPGASSLSVKATGGRGNVIAGNVFGRPAEIAPGVGVADGNHAAK